MFSNQDHKLFINHLMSKNIIQSHVCLTLATPNFYTLS